MKQFAPLAVTITALCIGLYSVGQQVYRQSAYDPEVQLAHDLAYQLDQSSTADAHGLFDAHQLAPLTNRKSLAPFVTVYNDKFQPIASTAAETLHPPAGVFAVALSKGEDRLSWQPADGMRFAIDVVPFRNGSTGGYVLAARSMAETEGRIIHLGRLVLMGWVATLIGTFVAVWLVNRSSAQPTKKGSA